MFAHSIVRCVSLLGLFLLSVNADIFQHPHNVTSQGYPTQELYTFPNGSWLESLAVRPAGNILATRLDEPVVYEFEVGRYRETKVKPVVKFPNATSCTGITEISRDVYAVLVGSVSPKTGGPVPKSWSVYMLDFQNSTAGVQVAQMAALTMMGMPNGVALYQTSVGSYLLMSDSILGALFKLDLNTMQVSKILDNKATKVAHNAAAGVDGLKVFGGVAYFTNAGTGWFASIPLTLDGCVTGNVSYIAQPYRADYPIKSYYDDFALDISGTAYAAGGVSNTVIAIYPNGTEKVIAGSLYKTTFAEPTDVAFGRTPWDNHTLYVTTGGGQGAAINGSVVVGAQLVAVQLPYLDFSAI